MNLINKTTCRLCFKEAKPRIFMVQGAWVNGHSNLVDDYSIPDEHNVAMTLICEKCLINREIDSDDIIEIFGHDFLVECFQDIDK